jgi:hypothetical protein
LSLQLSEMDSLRTMQQKTKTQVGFAAVPAHPAYQISA